MKLVFLVACVLGIMSLSACTTTEKVSTVQPGDRKMSCEELETAFTELDRVTREAEENKGVNTKNVAAAIFFWPAAVGNYMDADKAEELVEERRRHLVSIYEDKNC